MAENDGFIPRFIRAPGTVPLPGGRGHAWAFIAAQIVSGARTPDQVRVFYGVPASGVEFDEWNELATFTNGGVTPEEKVSRAWAIDHILAGYDYGFAPFQTANGMRTELSKIGGLSIPLQ
ncbi:MAG: hypothetical protein GY906_37145 [bacterium]|nr:hypothetical protein [bacterium]